MAMSKKDFVRLADHLRGHVLSGEVIAALLEFGKASNSRFNGAVFLGYMRGKCGPNGGKRGCHRNARYNRNWDGDGGGAATPVSASQSTTAT
jgi:hypothetical protein